MHKIISYGVIIGIIILIVIGASAYIARQSKDYISIGVLAPLTGPLSSINQYARYGLELALEEINSEGINGKKINLLYEDIGLCLPKLAVDATKKFIDVDRVSIILSLVCGGNQISATSKITESANVIHFSSSATISSVSDAGKLIFRNMVKDDVEMEQLAKYAINKLGRRRLFVIYIQTEWGNSYRDSIKQSFVEFGGEITGEAAADQTERDYRTYITKAKSYGTDVLFAIVPNGRPTGILLQQALELGLNIPIMTGYNTVTPDTIEVAKNAAEGIIFMYPQLPASNTANEFKKKYQKKYGEESEIHAANSYDMLSILASAMRKCDEETECIAQYIYGVQNYDGAGGITSFDERGDVSKPFSVWTIKNGERVMAN